MAYSDSHSLPLCIDLDGTLVKTDMLFESLARLLKHKPWLILLVPFWCLLGRAALKRKLASHVSIDVGSLPYNNALIAWLRVQKNRKRQLLLVTAADEQLAQPIADHLGFFDRVLASNGILNLKGKDKFRVLRQQVEGEFEYAGDSPADLEIWRHCHSAVTVGASPSLLRQIRKHVPEVKTFDGRRTSWMHYLAALRIHQWAKNVLIYVPLITAHRLQLDLMLEATFCVVVFGLCSSAQYILNDLVDLEADRAHPKKRERPFASGDIPLPVGFVLAPLLLVVSLGAAWFYSKALVALLAAYFLFSLTYSLYLKRIVLVDTFCLSTLYLLRIVAGHVVTGVAFSVWLLSFAFFLFLSLAFSKRWTELDLVRRTNGTMNGRGYGLDDTLQVNLFGVCSAFLSAVVFILYLQSDKVKELYRTPELLWILSPIYLYWISRIWILSTRGQVQEDPVVFVMKDRVTYLVGALCGLVMLAASRGWLT